MEGLLLAAEFLLTYLLNIAVLARTEFPSAETSVSSVIESTVEVVAFLEQLVDDLRRQHTCTCGRGSPKLGITEEQLLDLLHSDFSVCDIAALFGCSTKTIRRRVEEFGLSVTLHSNLSDSELDNVVCSFVYAHPANGQ